MSLNTRSFLAGLMLALWALAAIAQQQPKNIIVLYADGVAVTQWEFGRYSSRALRNAGFAVTDVVFHQGSIGFLTTHPYESFATDSAATASAASWPVVTSLAWNGLISSLYVARPSVRGSITGAESSEVQVRGAPPAGAPTRLRMPD